MTPPAARALDLAQDRPLPDDFGVARHRGISSHRCMSSSRNRRTRLTRRLATSIGLPSGLRVDRSSQTDTCLVSNGRAAALPRAVCLQSLQAAAVQHRSPAGRWHFRPTPVKLETAQAAPIEDTTEYVATLKSLRVDDDSAADRRADHRDLREVRRPRRARARGSSRSTRAAAGGRVEPGGRAGGARGRRRLRAAAAAARERALRGRRHQQAGARAGARRRCAPPKRGCRRCRRRCSSRRCSCATSPSTAPTAGVVGDVPVRVGNQVTPQTMLTTIDQNDTLEVYVQVPIERAAS